MRREERSQRVAWAEFACPADQPCPKEENTMKKLTMITLVALLASLFLGPVIQASSPTYSFNLTGPNTAMDGSGNTIRVTGSGNFDPAAATVVASGSFTQFDDSGSLVGRGTWSATQLVSFVSFGGPHPGILGGVLQLTVTLSPKGGPPQTDVPMSITCAVFAPPGTEEGTTVGDFTEKTGGLTLFHLNQ